MRSGSHGEAGEPKTIGRISVKRRGMAGGDRTSKAALPRPFGPSAPKHAINLSKTVRGSRKEKVIEGRSRQGNRRKTEKVTRSQEGADLVRRHIRDGAAIDQ